MPAASTIKPEERVFVVDSGASMHMVSKRDLNSAECCKIMNIDSNNFLKTKLCSDAGLKIVSHLIKEKDQMK